MINHPFWGTSILGNPICEENAKGTAKDNQGQETFQQPIDPQSWHPIEIPVVTRCHPLAMYDIAMDNGAFIDGVN